VHFFCAAGIVALVLLQRGKGAEAGAGFGAGASGTVFGARGATTALSRATAVLAGVFMVTSLALAYVGSKATPASNSVLERLSHQNPPTAPAHMPPGALPGPVPFGAPAGLGQTSPSAAQSTAPVAPSTGAAPAGAGGTRGNANTSGNAGTGNSAPSGNTGAPAHAPAGAPQGAPR
jgi:preprotein translocase subunit SecG